MFERHAFGVIFLKPFFGGVDIREHLDMVGVADLFAGIEVIGPPLVCAGPYDWG